MEGGRERPPRLIKVRGGGGAPVYNGSDRSIVGKKNSRR